MGGPKTNRIDSPDGQRVLALARELHQMFRSRWPAPTDELCNAILHYALSMAFARGATVDDLVQSEKQWAAANGLGGN